MFDKLIGKMVGIWMITEIFEGKKVVEFVINSCINLLCNEITFNLFDDDEDVIAICDYLDWDKYRFSKKDFNVEEIIEYIISEIEKEREAVEQEFIKSFEELKK